MRNFTMHPAGFRIFLPPERVETSDEYVDADPYDMGGRLDTDFQRRRFELTLDLIQRALADTGTAPVILDVGCGQAYITAAIRDAHPNAQVHGIDYSVSAIEHATRHFPGIEFSVADAYSCPYPDDSFDIVVCNNLWEHVPDPLRLLAELTRILKPRGSVIISTPSRYRLGNLLRVLVGKPARMMSAFHVTEYTVGQVREQLAFGGFDIVHSGSRRAADGLARSLIKAALNMILRLTRSHHCLEATVFYLARRKA